MLECQTAARDRFDRQRQFGALSNPSCSPTQMSSEEGRKKPEINPDPTENARFLVEIPDRFAVARWGREQDANKSGAETRRCHQNL